MDIFSEEQVTIADAFILNDLIVISTHSGLRFHVRLLKIADDGGVTVAKTYSVDGEVTCLSLGKVAGIFCIMAGLLREGASSIALYPIDESESTTPRIIELCPGKHYSSDDKTIITHLSFKNPSTTCHHRHITRVTAAWFRSSR